MLADVGNTLKVTVTAKNAAGETSATSASAEVLPAPPVNTKLPQVEGITQDGKTLSATNGEWEGTPTITYTYQWQDCDALGEGCLDISGASASTYELTPADVNSTLKVIVTAKNAAGETPATSSASAEVTATGPVNKALPAIKGEAQDEQTLTAEDGEWEGTPPITYTYQWQRCDSSGNNCNPISGASASTYKLTPADVGNTVKVTVTAKNTAGTTPATSPASAEVTAATPTNVKLPAISGTTKDEQTLSAENGEWKGTPPITYTYQWQRCDSSGNNCNPISGASASTYKLTPADVGNTVKVTVTAKNTAGTTPATSPASAEVTAATPTNVKLPAISGTTKDEQTLSAENGEWKGTPPITYTYQWQRCDSSGNNCNPISGASASTYKLTPADVGNTVKVTVTAKNTAGKTPATSPASAEVTAATPTNVKLPAISGTTKDEQTLSAENGEWKGTPPITYTYQWQRCDSSGNNCNPISGASASTYKLTPADVGNTVKVTVTAKNTAGKTPATSPASAEVTAATPTNVKLPAISGTTKDEQTLSAENGEWKGTPPITYTYQWQRCDSSGNNCNPISGASASTYKLTPADVGNTVKVTVTAKNTAGTTPATSPASAEVTAATPTNVKLPAISGTTKDEQTLSAENGEWKGTPPITYTYQWQRCDSSGNNCNPISGASASTYKLTPADVGNTVKVTVTAKNTAGTTPATSPASAEVTAATPTNVKLPAISGTTKDEQTLSAENGEWKGTPPITYTYQWQRCDSSGNNCNPISGASASTYKLTPADVGNTVKVTVTAKNTAGTTPATSPASAVVVAAPPSGGKPAIKGEAKDEQTLSAENGEWKGTPPITFTYQWQRCDSSGNNCNPISGASASTYKLTPADVGNTVKVTVTAKNTAGTTPATSPASAEVTAATPTNVKLPAISGTTKDEQTLSAENGEWKGTPPITYTYQWQRCDSSGNNCNPISGASASTYKLTPADVGNTVKVTVTAKNTAGTTPATSPASAEVTAATPTNVKLPKIEGTAKSGEPLKANVGEWKGTPPLAYSYEWERCNTSGGSCAAIATATAQTYKAVSADVGSTLRVIVTASNTAGASVPATSEPTAVVQAIPPANVTLPEIAGTARSGGKLDASTGTWTESPTSFTFQWLRCNSEGGSCAAISGATEQTYTPGPVDVGSTVKITVTATNSAGSSPPATSVQLAFIQPGKPTNVQPPKIEGTTQSGQTLTASNGEWTESPTSFTYQWLRCNSSGESCAAISGAKEKTYSGGSADVGSTLKVSVTAKNTAGETAATSAASAVISASKPVNKELPTISGTAQTGQTLTASNGEWTESPTKFAYQWQRCNESGTNCAAISGATEHTYLVTEADVGSTLKIAVSATNATGTSAPALSAQAAFVPPSRPKMKELPKISGAAETGQTLTASNGEWTEKPTTYTYQWERCDSSGAKCVAIALATTHTYTAVSADLGSTLRVVVTASNGVGVSEPATSEHTPVVAPASPPSNVVLPQAEGTAQIGQTLTASDGEWTESPTKYVYQWQRCNSGGTSCSAMSGATEKTYKAATADVGSTLRVAVTASNTAGSSSPVSSEHTAIVLPSPPVQTGTPPVISGTAEVGQTLTASNGEWTESPTKYAYQWQRCNSGGTSCAAISGATEKTYKAATADVGSTLRVAVTASNAAGPSSPASSEHTAVIQSAQAPQTFGTTTVGGSSDTFAANRKRVNRYALSTAGSVSKLSIYLAPTSNSGQQLIEGVVYAESAGAPTTLLGTSTPLTFKSTNVAGWYELNFATPLSLAAGNYWIGIITGESSGVAGFRYTSVTNSRDYNTNTYTSGPSNPFGTPTTDSEEMSIYATYSTAGPSSPPGNVTKPNISGTAEVGQTLTASNGEWTENPTSFAYQWQRCNSGGTSCAAISGATEKTYKAATADVGLDAAQSQSRRPTPPGRAARRAPNTRRS